MPPAVDTQSAAAGDAAATKRLKKREIDRRCQREARQRTKSRIAYLEGLVEELRRKDTSGQVSSLMHQVAEVRKERDMFARTLRGIEDSIRSHRSVLEGLPIKQEPTSPPPTSGPSGGTARDRAHVEMDSPTSMKSVSEAAENEAGTGTATANVGGPSDTISWGQPFFDSTSAGGIGQETQGPPIDMMNSEANCDCCEPTPPEETQLAPSPTQTQPDRKSIWRFAHTVLDQPPVVSSKVLRWEDQHSDDIPVRAVIDGWDAVVKRLGGRLPPLWAKLRRIDEVVFGNLDSVERLAILYVMHVLLRHHAEPSSMEARRKVPAWYLPRPSQTLSHAYALDFFTWPGIRERLIFSQHSYCSNLFWSAHNAGLKLMWQYDFRDCYSVNVAKGGAYQLSQAFQSRVTDINAWTMRLDFFQRWPEFYGDIPSLETNSAPMTRLVAPAKNEVAANAAARAALAKGRRSRVERGDRPDRADRGEIGRGTGEEELEAVESGRRTSSSASAYHQQQQQQQQRLHHQHHQQHHASLHSPPIPQGSILSSDAWKSSFMGRPGLLEQPNVYLPLTSAHAQEYIPMLSTTHSTTATWDMRSQGGPMPGQAQDWLWLSGGLDTGLSENG